MPRGFVVGMLRAPLVILGVVTLTFLLLHLAPGDPASYLLGPGATADQISAVRGALGLEQPLIEQYGRWIGRAVRGDFGISIATGRPVLGMLWEAWPATAILVGLSILLSYLIGILVAAVQATSRRRGVDGSLSLLTATYVEMAATKAHVPVVGWPVIALLNGIGPLGDMLVRRLRYPRSQTLVMNYLLVLRRRDEA